jgi:RND family efflux transporter MFP subunit
MRFNRGFLQAVSLVLSFCAVITIIVAGCSEREEEVVAARRNIVAYATIDGKIIAPAPADANIMPPYKAPVHKVYVTIGQKVREGEVLMELSAPSNQVYYQQARQRLQQARDQLAQARVRYLARLRKAKQELEQARQAERSVRQALKAAQTGKEISVTIVDLEEAIERRQVAQQAVIDAEARMAEGLVPYERELINAQQAFQEAQSGVKAAMIRSPISGTVLELKVKAGDKADPKKPVAHVTDLSALRVYAEVSGELSKTLTAGSPATIIVKELPNEEFRGFLRNVYSKEAGLLRGVEHIAVFDFVNRDGLAKPEMSARVRVKVGEAKNVLSVPLGAVYKTNGRQAVKLRVNDQWRTRIVETGISDGEYIEIKSGLREGDVVLMNP